MNGKKIDRSTLDSVLALNDEQLKAAVHALAVAGGMNEARAAIISQNAGMIRKKLGAVSEEEIKTMLGSVDAGQLEQIASQLSDALKKQK